MIVDLRNPLDVETEGSKLPGALLMAPDDLEARHQEIPRDRDIILYCT
jgi:rhodanese-related sulfurtransferase